MENVWFVSSFVTQRRKTTEQFDCDIYYFMVEFMYTSVSFFDAETGALLCTSLGFWTLTNKIN